MPYHFLDHLTRADVAFEASAATLEELFRSAAEATLQTMVSDLSSIRGQESLELELHAPSIEWLLYDLLQKIVFFKDAKQLFLKPQSLTIQKSPEGYDLRAWLCGDVIDPDRQELLVDVKAVTMHQFRVEKNDREWRAVVVLDV